MDNLKEKAHIFGSIFILANRLQVIGDKFDKNITIKQWLLLVGILNSNSSEPTISEVANMIGNSRQNVKKMAVILEKKGFITLKKDPDDARIIRISLAKKCQEYFKKRESKELDFFEKLYDGFDTALVTGFNNGILKLEENVVRMEGQNE